jgi:hypothetical protein
MTDQNTEIREQWCRHLVKWAVQEIRRRGWREFLAEFALRELRKTGKHMTPDGTVRSAARATRQQAARGYDNGALYKAKTVLRERGAQASPARVGDRSIILPSPVGALPGQ